MHLPRRQTAAGRVWRGNSATPAREKTWSSLGGRSLACPSTSWVLALRYAASVMLVMVYSRRVFGNRALRLAAAAAAVRVLRLLGASAHLPSLPFQASHTLLGPLGTHSCNALVPNSRGRGVGRVQPSLRTDGWQHGGWNAAYHLVRSWDLPRSGIPGNLYGGGGG